MATMFHCSMNPFAPSSCLESNGVALLLNAASTSTALEMLIAHRIGNAPRTRESSLAMLYPLCSGNAAV